MNMHGYSFFDKLFFERFFIQIVNVVYIGHSLQDSQILFQFTAKFKLWHNRAGAEVSTAERISGTKKMEWEAEEWSVTQLCNLSIVPCVWCLTTNQPILQELLQCPFSKKPTAWIHKSKLSK
jgi:hypothetical protein